MGGIWLRVTAGSSFDTATAEVPSASHWAAVLATHITNSLLERHFDDAATQLMDVVYDTRLLNVAPMECTEGRSRVNRAK